MRTACAVLVEALVSRPQNKVKAETLGVVPVLVALTKDEAAPLQAKAAAAGALFNLITSPSDAIQV